MFDIGFPELMVAALVALVILGPERLPGALRSMGLMLGRLRRSYTHVKAEIEKEIGMDEVRRQLHNEQIMEDVERMRREVDSIGEELKRPTFLDEPAADENKIGETDAAPPTSQTNTGNANGTTAVDTASAGVDRESRKTQEPGQTPKTETEPSTTAAPGSAPSQTSS